MPFISHISRSWPLQKNIGSWILLFELELLLLGVSKQKYPKFSVLN